MIPSFDYFSQHPSKRVSDILDPFEKLLHAELGHGCGFNCHIDFQIKWIKEGDPVKIVRTKNRSLLIRDEFVSKRGIPSEKNFKPSKMGSSVSPPPSVCRKLVNTRRLPRRIFASIKRYFN